MAGQKKVVDETGAGVIAANRDVAAGEGIDAITGRYFPAVSTITVGDHDNNSYGEGENKGIGISASVPAGEGATVSFGYSTNKYETSTAAEGFYSADGTAQAADGDANVEMSGKMETKRISVDFAYDLGGGATFKAGIEKDDTEKNVTVTNLADTSVLPDGDDDGTDPDDSASFMTSSDKTTLKAVLAFSF